MDAKKQLIMEAAKKSFSLFGYKGTTMDQIAKIAGVGKATIYTFFENKEVLLNDIIQSLIAEMKDVAGKALAEGETPIAKIHSALYEILVFRKEHELLIQLAHEVQQFGSPVTIEAMASIEKEVVQFIAEHIQKAIHNGTMKACEPKMTAFILFKLYVALVFDWEKQNEPLTDEKILSLLQIYFGNFLN
ncbi:TetR/AcrR family transcriptional regulator [Paenibacillus sp. GCM10023248]|uniref:TetR/AcrR family transcriptional regulator n=1 Tax=Bacillales TaxID=1385 RepID=UPI0023786EB7|nr:MULTISPECIES: TetR/AcrR family transcriptional regulator [Bacillales]MDD9272262.1 TetR/AcrR family transcriptional regulator [Paenibacillus sp. MAHUQ-63]MDR6885387.1 AcrR family transcriptional regulator [Bacillus sp. 3255]